MAKQKKKIYVLIVILLFVFYFFAAARPIPNETVLTSGWIRSLAGAPAESLPNLEYQAPSGNVSERFLPFTLGSRFGYVDPSGQFSINRIQNNYIYLGENMWAEYPAEPSNIAINDIFGETIINIEDAKGYPVLLDNRVFIFGSEQNSLSEINADGKSLWTYEFGAPLTCIDAAAGLVLTGSLDGVIEILNSEGRRVFYFEPGGSRYNVILGCAISSNGSRIGIVSGIAPQRFLLLERLGNTGGEYRVVYHEFLGDGFRRPVRISFIDDDRRIVFERAGGIGCYNIRSRRGIFIPLDGYITAMDESGADGLLFLITSHPNQNNELVGIRFTQERRFLSRFVNTQDSIFMKASFKSDDVFLGRIQTGGSASMLIAGGGTTLISFDLEDR